MREGPTAGRLVPGNGQGRTGGGEQRNRSRRQGERAEMGHGTDEVTDRGGGGGGEGLRGWDEGEGRRNGRRCGRGRGESARGVRGLSPSAHATQCGACWRSCPGRPCISRAGRVVLRFPRLRLRVAGLHQRGGSPSWWRPAACQSLALCWRATARAPLPAHSHCTLHPSCTPLVIS